MRAQPQSAAPIQEWKSILEWKPIQKRKSFLIGKPTCDPRKTNRAAMPLEARFREATA